MRSARAITTTAGRWSAAHPWRAIAVWVGFVVVVLTAGNVTGARQLTDTQAVGAGDAGRAMVAIDRDFTRHAGESVLVQSSTLTFDSDAYQSAVIDLSERLLALPDVINLRSPALRGFRNQVSADGHSALLQLDLAGPAETGKQRVGPVLAAVQAVARAHPEVTVSEAGDASLAKAVDETVLRDYRRAELLSVPITLLVLIGTFGALVAAVIPLGLAITAYLGATGLLALVSHLNGSHPTATSVMLLVGLAVGVDYSLFYLKREREERAAGRARIPAITIAAATSGRSVFISGLTVLVAMAGMFFTGNGLFAAIATATMLVVLASVVGSLTVLPAVLSLLGDKVERGRIPVLGRVRHAERESRVWGFVLDRALRRPVVAATVAAAVLLVLALPARGLHTATPGATDLPRDIAVLRAYDRIQAAFPGGGAPALVVVSANLSSPGVQQAISSFTKAALATHQMNEPITVLPNQTGRAAIISVPLAGNGEDAASAAALRTLRHDVVPATLGRAGIETHVGGMTAGTEDFNTLMRTRWPYVFTFVLLLAFLLLLVSFRSLVVAVTAIVLNLLSVAAAYGVLVAVFQWGWGEHLLGFTSTGAIASYLPLFLFVILFGLSMDYHVFIISRIREAYDRGEGTEAAVTSGIRSTAGVVTAAAVVMVFVFLTFATLSQVSLKEIGVGLSVAVLLDATLVRGVLLPATMKLLGPSNWYLPRWLGWLPEVSTADVAPADLAFPPPRRAPEQQPAHRRHLSRH